MGSLDVKPDRASHKDRERARDDSNSGLPRGLTEVVPTGLTLQLLPPSLKNSELVAKIKLDFSPAGKRF
jgi:hypothetical protein